MLTRSAIQANWSGNQANQNAIQPNWSALYASRRLFGYISW